MEEIGLLPVYKCGEIVAWAIVDVDDLPTLMQWCWYMRPGSFVARRETVGPRQRRLIYLHRQIAGLPPGAGRPSKTRLEVDHINRHRLDNRRANLRICTGAQNSQNTPARGGTSRYRGVSWCPQMNGWLAAVVLNYKLHRLGYYDTEEGAAEIAAAFRAEHMPFSEDARHKEEMALV